MGRHNLMGPKRHAPINALLSIHFQKACKRTAERRESGHNVAHLSVTRGNLAADTTVIQSERTDSKFSSVRHCSMSSYSSSCRRVTDKYESQFSAFNSRRVITTHHCHHTETARTLSVFRPHRPLAVHRCGLCY